MYTHAHSHTQIDTQSQRDTHTTLTHILIRTCSFTDTRVLTHSLYTLVLTHSPHSYTAPRPAFTLVYSPAPPLPAAQSLWGQGPLVPPLSCSPAHPLALGQGADTSRQPAPRRQVCRLQPCLFVVALGNADSAHTELRQAIKSGLWGLSGASLVTSGRWLSLPPCPSHIMCHLHSQAPSGEKGETFLLGEECGVWPPWPPN